MKPISSFLLTALIVAVTASASRAQSSPAASNVRPAPLHIQTQALPNGLRLVMVEDHRTPIINLQVWYHVGSKDERTGRTGFAHLFEHLMFQGSEHVAPEQHTRFIEAMGGVSNAYTTEDVTVFFETLPSNYLARAMWMEADRMGGLKITPENFSSEREVVKEERRLRVDNAPYGRVFEDLDAAAFTVHPYHHPVIGSMEDLDKATVDDVREFFRAYYRPDNATLILAGDFAAQDAVRIAAQYFGGISRPAQPVRRIRATEPPQQAERRVTKSYPNTPLPAVVMAYRIPAEFASDAYPLELASNILSAGESSMLYRKLIYEDRMAVEVSGDGNFSEDPNLFITLAVMNQGKTPAEGEKGIESVLNQMKSTPVDAHELDKAKNQQISGFILGRQTVQRKASALGRYAVIGKDANRYNTELDRYVRVSAADIRRVAQAYFVSGHRTVLVVEPAPAQGPQSSSKN